MSDEVIVAAGTIPRGNFPRAAKYLAYYWRSSGWLDERTPALETSPYDNGAPFKLVELTASGENPTNYIQPQHSIPSTEDALINPGGLRLGAFLLDENKRLLERDERAALPNLASFRVPPASLYPTVSLVDLAGYNATTLPPVNPGDVSVGQNLTAGGQVAGATGAFSGGVTAQSFTGTHYGNGANLTGITGATGGVSNLNSTTIGADTNADGDGVIGFQTRNLDRFKIYNDGRAEAFVSLWEAGARVLSTESLGLLSTSHFADLAALVSFVGSTPTPLMVAQDETVSANLIIPATSQVSIGAGKITVNNGVTLTINSFSDPGARQVFNLVGTGKVVFGSRVRLIRPEWFGTGAAALQAAAASLPASGARIEISDAFTINTPLWIDNDYTTLSGRAGYQGTRTALTSTVRGAAVLIGRPATAPNYVTALATGTGQALSVTGTFQRPLNFGDGGTVELNGLAALSVSGYLKFSTLTGTGGSPSYIMSSFGRLLNSDTPTQCFALRSYSDGSIDVRIRTANAGGTNYTATSAAGVLTTGATKYVEATYDGTTLRLFVGTPGGTAALVASVAATGALKQEVAEDVCLGAPPLDWPDAGFFYGCDSFVCDVLHISNNARHTAAFTAPTAKPTPDSHTLILCNFDRGDTFPFVIADSKDGDVYLVFRSQTDGGYTSYCEVENLSILSSTGSALYLYNCPNARVRDLTLSGRYGLHVLGQSFISRFENIHAGTDAVRGRAGIIFAGTPSAASTIDGMNVQGFPYGLVSFGGLARINNSFANAYSDTIAPIVIKGQPPNSGEVTFNSLWLDDETAAGAGVTRKAGIIFSGLSGFRINGGFIWMSQNAVPLVLIDNPDAGFSGEIAGARMVINDSATEVIKFTGTAPASPLRINGVRKGNIAGVASTVAWANDMRYVTVDGDGIINQSLVWNDGATVFTAIRSNVTDTASNGASKLLELLVNNAWKFRVTKDGAVTALGDFYTSAGFGDSNATFSLYSTIGLRMHNTSVIKWAGGSNIFGSFDAGFARAGAGAVKATDGGSGYGQFRCQSLGVNNAANATTPGSVTKKIEVFDAGGSSLGFIPVYSSIS